MERTVPNLTNSEPTGESTGRLAWVPTAVLAAFLLLTTASEGAFAVRQWAPLAVLAVTALAAAVAVGGARLPAGPVRLAVLGLWGLTLWCALSTLWSEEPGPGLNGAGRLALYAALFTFPCVTAISRRARMSVGWLLTGGIAVIAFVTLMNVLLDGGDAFLAGRLNSPIGYRNATACLFGLALWPLIALAGRRRLTPLLRAPAFAAACLCLGLAFLTQGRGVVLAIAAGGVVMLSLGPNRIRNAWTALAVAVPVALASKSLLTPYDAFVNHASVSSSDVSTAGRALAVATIVAFVVGLAASLLDSGLRLDGPERRRARQIAGAMLAGVAVVAIAAALVAVGNPVTYAKDRVNEFRDVNGAATGATRLTYTGGQRSDLWRVALDEFGTAPVQGVGAGSYALGYFEHRHSDRNLSDPHSSVLGILAELGLVGLLLLALSAGGVIAAIVSRWRALDDAVRWWGSAMLAAGLVVIVQSTVDWLWLIPGVTGMGFLCLGLAVGTLRPAGAGTSTRFWRIGGATVLAVFSLGIAALYLSNAYVRRARAAKPDAPQARLDSARSAHRWNPWAPSPYFLQASALEDLGRPAQARRQLLDALDVEPHSFVVMGLLGDFEARQGHPAVARVWYRRALRENPRDVGLQKLARGA